MSNATRNISTLSKITVGTDPGLGGMWPDVTPATSILRLRDRLFLGDAAVATGNNTGTQGGKVPTGVEGANWAIRDGQMVSFATNGNLAIVGFSRSQDTTREPCAAIGVAGVVIGNHPVRSVWGLYSDVQFEQGTSGWGAEIAVKNKTGIDQTATPYFEVGGAVGIWLPAGGDPTYGGAPTNPNNSAIQIGTNSSTWNKGIVFFKNGLTGTDGITGAATAIEMARGHSIVWRAPGNYGGFTLRSDISGSSNTKSLITSDLYFNFYGNNGSPIFLIKDSGAGGGSADNYWTFESSNAGNPVVLRILGNDTDVGAYFVAKGRGSFRFTSAGSGTNDEFRVGGVNTAPVNYLHAYGSNSGTQLALLEAKGTDSNINIRLIPKGSGLVSFGSWTSNIDTAITGFILVTDEAGNQRKLATIA